MQWQRKTLNVAQLGVGMLLIFFVFFSQAFIVVTVLENRHQEDSSINKNAGYYSQTLIYVSFIFGNLFAPTLISFLGLRWALICGGIPYTIYMIGFLFLNSFLLYFTSILSGFMAGLVLWTSVGHYIASNSSDKTISKHSNLMWLIYMPSMILGGAFLIAIFGSKEDNTITMATTRTIYGTFAVVSLIGVIVLALLKHECQEEGLSKKNSNMRELVETYKLLKTRDQWLIAIPCAFAGLETSFFSSVYPTALSFTKSFSINTNQLMGMNAIATGIGELVAAGILMRSGGWADRVGRWPLMWMGTLMSLISYGLIGLNLPSNSTHEVTHDQPITSNPSIILGLLCGFLLGFMDCCVNTRIYAYIAIRYPKQTNSAFALFNFWLGLFSAICMLYGSVASLYFQLSILAIGSIAASIAYMIVDRRLMEGRNEISQLEIDGL